MKCSRCGKELEPNEGHLLRECIAYNRKMILDKKKEKENLAERFKKKIK